MSRDRALIVRHPSSAAIERAMMRIRLLLRAFAACTCLLLALPVQSVADEPAASSAAAETVGGGEAEARRLIDAGRFAESAGHPGAAG